jgi:hypothetical protein
MVCVGRDRGVELTRVRARVYLCRVLSVFILCVVYNVVKMVSS